MRVIEAAQRGRIKVVPDGSGGVTIEGRRDDVVRIEKAVAKRERRNAKRLDLQEVEARRAAKAMGLGFVRGPIPFLTQDRMEALAQPENMSVLLDTKDWPVRIIDTRPGTVRSTIVQSS